MVLAGIAVEDILAERFRDAGVVNHATWISPQRLVDRLHARGLRLWWLPDGASDWRPYVHRELESHRRH